MALVAVDGLNHYNLRAQRPLLDLLRDFYVDVIGLRLGFRPAFESFGYWLYAGGKDIVHLTEASKDELRPPDAAGTFDHVAFTCSDLGSIQGRLSAHGVAFATDDVPLTGQIQLFLKDPAGNGVELNFLAPTPEPSLERRDR